MAVGEHFDIVFIDAAQRNAVNDYNFVMDNHLLRMDGVICVENTLMKGQVYLENISDENVLAVRKLNNVINSDPRVEQVSAVQLVKGYIGIVSIYETASAILCFRSPGSRLSRSCCLFPTVVATL